MTQNNIPTLILLKNILSDINHYAATKELDKDNLLNKFTALHNFQEFCYSTIEDIAPFVEDPTSVDLQNLSEKISKKISNIDKQIHIYLENELKDLPNEQEKGDL